MKRGAGPLVLGLFLAAGAAACSSGDTGSGTSTTIAAASSGGGGSTATTAPAGKGSAGGDPVAVREIDAYRFEVLSAEVLPNDQALLPPAKGNAIVGINLAVTNTSNTDQPVSTFAQLAMKLPDGTSAQEVPPETGVAAFKDGNLEPGKQIKGLVLYEVPAEDLSKLVFQMAGDLTDNLVEVELHLSPR
jgi:hypothetical protein